MGNVGLITVSDRTEMLKKQSTILENFKVEHQDKFRDFHLCNTGGIFKTFTVRESDAVNEPNQQQLILKIHVRPDSAALKVIEENVIHFNNLIDTNTNPYILKYTRVLSNADYGAVIRSYHHITLAERFQRNVPFTSMERKWIAFQALAGLALLHEAKVFHGDIKPSNILLTATSHVFLADFAPFKPLLLGEDDLGSYNIFFDNYGKRCYVAPEKFTKDKTSQTVEPVKQMKAEQIKAMQQMDVFSLGCVLAEIFMKGKPCFDYKTLKLHRNGDGSVLSQALHLIKKPKLKQILSEMLDKSPNNRKSARIYLARLCADIFPSCFVTTYYHLDTAFLSPAFSLPDLKIALIHRIIRKIYDEAVKATPDIQHHLPPAPPIADINYCQLLHSVASVRPNLSEFIKVSNQVPLGLAATLEAEVSQPVERPSQRSGMTITRLESLLRRKAEVKAAQRAQRSASVLKGMSKIDPKSKSFLVLLMLISPQLHVLQFLSSYLQIIEILANLGKVVYGWTRMNAILPLLFSLLEQKHTLIASSAVKAIVDICGDFRDTDMSKIYEKPILSKFLLPNLEKMLRNPSTSVQTSTICGMTKLLNLFKCVEAVIGDSATDQPSQSGLMNAVTDFFQRVINGRVLPLSFITEQVVAIRKRYPDCLNERLITELLGITSLALTSPPSIKAVEDSLQAIRHLIEILTKSALLEIIKKMLPLLQYNEKPIRSAVGSVMEAMCTCLTRDEVYFWISPRLSKIFPNITSPLVEKNTIKLAITESSGSKSFQTAMAEESKKPSTAPPNLSSSNSSSFIRRNLGNELLEYLQKVLTPEEQQKRRLEELDFALPTVTKLKRALLKELYSHGCQDLQAEKQPKLQNLIILGRLLNHLRAFDIPDKNDIVEPGKFLNQAAAYGATGDHALTKPTGTLVATLYEHKDLITALEYLPNSHFFMSGSRDGAVKIYDLSDIEEYSCFEGY